MKNPGPIKANSEFHRAVVDFTEALAKHYEMAKPAALGQIVKFCDAIGKAGQTSIGMASLKIEVVDSQTKEQE